MIRSLVNALFGQPRLRGAPMRKVPRGFVRVGGQMRWVWGFELDIRPVSNRDWLEFMHATNARRPDWMFRTGFDDPEQPIVGINAAEAEAYARWAGKRLPTEPEWLRAVGDGPYPWGAAGVSAKYAHMKARAPAAPGRPDGAGPYGHEDLVGNVWERLAGGVARGGFFGSTDPSVRERLVVAPTDISSGLGFRCAR